MMWRTRSWACGARTGWRKCCRRSRKLVAVRRCCIPSGNWWWHALAGCSCWSGFRRRAVCRRHNKTGKKGKINSRVFSNHSNEAAGRSTSAGKKKRHKKCSSSIWESDKNSEKVFSLLIHTRNSWLSSGSCWRRCVHQSRKRPSMPSSRSLCSG